MILTTAMLWCGCSTTRHVPDGSYLLHHIALESDTRAVDASAYSTYVRPNANSKWFSLLKVPLAIYSLSGHDSTQWVNRTLRKLGEAPVIYDSLRTQHTAQTLRAALHNKGFMNARVDVSVEKKRKKASVRYTLHPGSQFYIRSIRHIIDDDTVRRLLQDNSILHGGLREGQPLTITALEDERKRIASFLQDNGYYRFHQDYIIYDADSVAGSPMVDLTLHILPYYTPADTSAHNHPRFRIRNVEHVGVSGGRIHLRRHTIEDNTLIMPGDWYSTSIQHQTYSRFGRLPIIRYTGISYRETPDSLQLDATIQLDTHKPNSISFQPEGTNTAGDLGAAATLTYENRNLFRGGERLNISVRAAFEAITGLEGYQNKDYEEYGIEAQLVFPNLVAPFIPRHVRRRLNAASTVIANYNMQQRPEFHRRVFAATWRYRWNSGKQSLVTPSSAYHGTGQVPGQGLSKTLSCRLDLVDLNYIHMPWISETFKRNYLDSVSNRNVILRYNYEDMLIMKTGFGFTYNTARHALRFNVETGGNMLALSSHMFGSKKNAQGQYKVFNIAYAQYAKADIDYTRALKIDTHNSLILHTALGIAYPYGNSRVLPFEKRYFSGGANSVRGWGVRRLGPGKFKGKDGQIDFINQTGDIKIDVNLEYRTHLFWKINGAAFIDAGNIWILRHYDDQEGGQFRFGTFYKQLAAAYGIGLRFNFDYFVLRFDMGMKAVNPAYEEHRDHYPILHHSMSRDFHFHFAVGLPF